MPGLPHQFNHVTVPSFSVRRMRSIATILLLLLLLFSWRENFGESTCPLACCTLPRFRSSERNKIFFPPLFYFKFTGQKLTLLTALVDYTYTTCTCTTEQYIYYITITLSTLQLAYLQCIALKVTCLYMDGLCFYYN